MEITPDPPSKKPRKTGRRLLAAILTVAFLGWGYRNAIQPPIVRSASIKLPRYPAGAPALRLLLLSDTHIQGPDTPPGRLERIVADANRLRPDLVVLAGDFEGDSWTSTTHYSVRDAVAPLAALRARYGVFAVLGNHDHRDERAAGVRAELQRAGILELRDSAVEVGPLALGGADDDHTRRYPFRQAVAVLRTLPGARILVSHNPRKFRDVPADIHLLLGGHTHCGQVGLAWIGTLFFGRHGCGLSTEGDRTIVVTSGIGTSHLPLRYFAPPDMWLITIHG
jgi:predicted MPP superfamily phosphohydrolase